MWFPIVTQDGAIVNGVWRVDFPVLNRARVVQWIALRGSAGTVNVYVGTTFVDTTPNGDVNRADYYKGIPLAAGQQFSLVWANGNAAPIVQASIGCTDGDENLTQALTGQQSIFTS